MNVKMNALTTEKDMTKVMLKANQLLRANFNIDAQSDGFITACTVSFMEAMIDNLGGDYSIEVKKNSEGQIVIDKLFNSNDKGRDNIVRLK